MASLTAISSAAVADPAPALVPRYLSKASPFPSGMMCVAKTPRIGLRAPGLRLRSSPIAAVNASRTYGLCMPVCLFGGKGESKGDSEVKGLC